MKIVIKKLEIEEILEYLDSNSEIFIPPLKNRVNLTEFATKINNNAIHFCAIDNHKLIGFLASYFNQPQKEFGYITTISVTKEYQGMGVASKLINEVLSYAKMNHFRNIKLEVNKQNAKAIDFYVHKGFVVFETKGDSLFMNMQLDKE